MKNYNQHISELDANRIPLSLPVYQKIKTTSHTFQKGQWYSLRSLAQILGFSATGIRQRCIVDSWPTLPVYFSAGRIRRPQFVDGAFLADIQQAIRGGEQ